MMMVERKLKEEAQARARDEAEQRQQAELQAEQALDALSKCAACMSLLSERR